MNMMSYSTSCVILVLTFLPTAISMAYFGTVNAGNLYQQSDPFTMHDAACVGTYGPQASQCTLAQAKILYSQICAKSKPSHIIVNDQARYAEGYGYYYMCSDCNGQSWTTKCNGQPVPCCDGGRTTTTAPTKGPTSQPTRNPTTPPTQAPTHFPTENPTLPPTSFPTTTPTKGPTLHPCDTDQHGCDTTAEGVCFRLGWGSTAGAYRCGCMDGYQCYKKGYPTVTACDQVGHKCVPITHAPTQLPTSSTPTQRPTAAPTPSPTFVPTAMPTSSLPTAAPSAAPTPRAILNLHYDCGAAHTNCLQGAAADPKGSDIMCSLTSPDPRALCKCNGAYVCSGENNTGLCHENEYCVLCSLNGGCATTTTIPTTISPVDPSSLTNNAAASAGFSSGGVAGLIFGAILLLLLVVVVVVVLTKWHRGQRDDEPRGSESNHGGFENPLYTDSTPKITDESAYEVTEPNDLGYMDVPATLEVDADDTYDDINNIN